MLTGRISQRTAGWAGVTSILTTAVTIGAAVVLFDGYDWGQHNLSTLGHVDNELAAGSRLVFSGGLVVTALLGLVFAVGLYRLADRRLWRAGAVLYAISQGTVAWQGVFPAGVPQHDWLSIFPFFVAALVCIGVDQIRAPETRLYGVVVLSTLAVASLGALLVLGTDIEGWAIHQTLGVAVFAIATLLYAGRLLDVLTPTARPTPN